MIREPAVAGMFYPGNPDFLTADIRAYLDDASVLHDKRPLGFIVPHAGYIYSGPIAAFAYKYLEGKKYDKVVILAPSHYDGFDGISIYPGEALKTPLGIIEVSDEDRQFLIKKHSVLSSDIGHRQEHSLEVQLPFLQCVLQPNWKVIPLVMGFQYRETIDLGTKVLKEFINKDTLIIISSDLSHYYPYEKAKEIDGRFCDLIKTGDLDTIWDAHVNKNIEACGFGPIFAFLTSFRDRKDISPEVLDNRNSGDTAGSMDQVVGYCAIGYFWET